MKQIEIPIILFEGYFGSFFRVIPPTMNITSIFKIADLYLFDCVRNCFIYSSIFLSIHFPLLVFLPLFVANGLLNACDVQYCWWCCPNQLWMKYFWCSFHTSLFLHFWPLKFVYFLPPVIGKYALSRSHFLLIFCCWPISLKLVTEHQIKNINPHFALNIWITFQRFNLLCVILSFFSIVQKYGNIQWLCANIRLYDLHNAAGTVAWSIIWWFVVIHCTHLL